MLHPEHSSDHSVHAAEGANVALASVTGERGHGWIAILAAVTVGIALGAVLILVLK